MSSRETALKNDPQLSLARYEVDTTTGFVPAAPPLKHLPPSFAPWDALVPDLSALIRSRRVRSALQSLPLLDIRGLDTAPERERALLLLSVFANAWVWGGDQPHLSIPAPVAVPLCALATLLDRPPIAHYASMTLNNWQLLDARQPVSPDNARMQVQFLGGVDEDWFFMASLGVELAGAPLLQLVVDAQAAAGDGADDALLTQVLQAFAAGLIGVQAALRRIREWCDPHTYYRRVRPYLSGWPEPGVVYDGVHAEPRRYIGGSAGQSSLFQVFDAVLGLAHPDKPAGGYLRAIRAYMPPAHRAFVEDVERQSLVRSRAQQGSPALRSAYNDCLDQVDLFREIHMQLAQDFVVTPSGSSSDVQGTGGTALKSFLRGAQHATVSAKL